MELWWVGFVQNGGGNLSAWKLGDFDGFGLSLVHLPEDIFFQPVASYNLCNKKEIKPNNFSNL